MSTKTQDVMKMNKTVLQELVKDLQSGKSVKQLSNQVQELMALKNDLEDKLNEKDKQNEMVAIEKMSKGHVWLRSPEASSGSAEDVNKGRLLTKEGQVVAVPAYWMIEYIAEENLAFTAGSVRVNNELGKKLYPKFNFADLNLPESFISGSISNMDIQRKLKARGDAPYDYINDLEGNMLMLSRVSSILFEMLSNEKPNTAGAAHIHALYEHAITLLNPANADDNEVEDKK